MTVFMGGLGSPYYAGLSLVIVGTGLLFVWPARVVLFTHATIIATFLASNLVAVEIGQVGDAVSNLAFLIATAIITGTGQIVVYRLQRDQTVSQLQLEQTKSNLEKAHEQLKALDRFKSQFFANITHEFKTPLAMILSPLELLLHGEMGEVNASQRATFEMMFRSGMKLLKMVTDLLDLSKLEESRLRLKIGEHDLVELVRALVEHVQLLAERKKIELKLVTALPRCPVHCDPERLERVFVNLLSNALKFTPEGGHVAVSVDDAGDHVRVVVEDDGPGFPPSLAEKIFERFFQVDMGETRRYGGTGIGLALAKEIVELHGGRIGARSDRGARFAVELLKGKEHFRPEVIDRRSQKRDVLGGSRATDRGLMDFAAQIQSRNEFRLLDIHEATEERIVERNPEQDQRTHTCLVVEDTPDVIRLVTMALRHEFRVLSAPDGLVGLALAQEEVPDLVVTDLMMPGLDGLELTKRIRADPRTRHIPIVMLTARGELDDRVAGIETGVNAYIAKPFSPRELLSAARGLVKVQSTTAEILLSQRMDSLVTVAGGLAHEINNPLNYVKNALARVRLDAEVLLHSPSAEDAKRIERRLREMFDIAESGIRRIARTVDLMGSYSRAGYTRKLRPHDVFQAVREVVALVLPATGRKVKVDTNLTGDGRVECVPEEFNQVLTNLVQNAIEAAPDGTGAVEVHGRVEGAELVLKVRDNGHGIKAEDRARVFTPFFTTKGPGRGTGLGLSQVYGFARQSGGAAVVESAPGKGATIRVYLPLAQASAEQAQSAAEAPAPQQGPARRVLLVEDDASVGEMVEAMLTDLGHEVLRAEAAAPALEILERFDRIDLLLTDLIMPGGMNGVELAHKAVALRPGLPVILTSGYTGETLGPAAEAPWPLLAKPYPAEALAAIIEAVIGKTPEAAV
jgi:signal transduction histidine kinase